MTCHKVDFTNGEVKINYFHKDLKDGHYETTFKQKYKIFVLKNMQL